MAETGKNLVEIVSETAILRNIQIEELPELLGRNVMANYVGVNASGKPVTQYEEMIIVGKLVSTDDGNCAVEGQGFKLDVLSKAAMKLKRVGGYNFTLEGTYLICGIPYNMFAPEDIQKVTDVRGGYGNRFFEFRNVRLIED